MAKKKIKPKKKMSKFLKWTIGILVALAAGAAIFCGLYFGVPVVHDWVNGVETVKETVETTAKFIM